MKLVKGKEFCSDSLIELGSSLNELVYINTICKWSGESRITESISSIHNLRYDFFFSKDSFNYKYLFPFEFDTLYGLAMPDGKLEMSDILDPFEGSSMDYKGQALPKLFIEGLTVKNKKENIELSDLAYNVQYKAKVVDYHDYILLI